MTHSFPTNLAKFSTTNPRIENGILYIDLKRAPEDHEKPDRGVEMRSIEALKYGKVETRASFAKGSGVVSSLVLIYTPWPADDWNELDFEYLGAFKDRIQTNAMVYTGPPVRKPVDHSVPPAGSVGEHFPRAEIAGLDARIGGALPIGENLEVRLVLNYVRYWASFHSRPGDTYIAGGALEQIVNADLGLSAFF